MENKAQLVHIGAEIVVGLGILVYLSNKNRKLESHVTELSKKVDLLEQKQKLFESLLTSLISELQGEPQQGPPQRPLVQPQPRRPPQQQPHSQQHPQQQAQQHPQAQQQAQQQNPQHPHPQQQNHSQHPHPQQQNHSQQHLQQQHSHAQQAPAVRVQHSHHHPQQSETSMPAEPNFEMHPELNGMMGLLESVGPMMEIFSTITANLPQKPTSQKSRGDSIKIEAVSETEDSDYEDELRDELQELDDMTTPDIALGAEKRSPLKKHLSTNGHISPTKGRSPQANGNSPQGKSKSINGHQSPNSKTHTRTPTVEFLEKGQSRRSK